MIGTRAGPLAAFNVVEVSHDHAEGYTSLLYVSFNTHPEITASSVVVIGAIPDAQSLDNYVNTLLHHCSVLSTPIQHP